MESSILSYLEAELKENSLHPVAHQLIIDNKFISYDDKILSCNDIIAIRYGSMQMLVFHRLKTGRYHKIELKDKNNNIITIFFGYSKLSDDNGEKEHNYDKIMEALWHAVKKRMVNEALDSINNNGSYKAGDCTVTKDGVKVKIQRIFSKKEYFIPWSELERTMGFGKFYIISKIHKVIKCKIHFLKTWNSVVLFTVLKYITENKKNPI